ncbi:prepilin-type N-terminal cleavage/methylation domain-containing protein [Alteromonas sp. MMG017]|uniref:PulJ/GspJ family protein n=1 Tax=Alteromonas sp. MMG017 TaxID=2822692 RepID=UPI001B3A4F3E|nr:prepilin-type N-terminal cleavage/methylation domain-containing protein [Alteromonas sp. MMG017]MBQ4829649.1 prepilin-type N-terminal cleavage/methylation domain-containing protein [Alteromonas sp. MMG017]
MTLIKKTQGFSLIEVIIASGLFALTFTAGLKLYQQIYGQWQQLNKVQQAQHQLETDQTNLLINVNTNQDAYTTITPSSTTSGLKAVTLVEVVEPLPKFNYTDEAVLTDKTHTDKTLSEGNETTTEEINAEEAPDDAQELIEKVKTESQAINLTLTVVVAPPYQSHWQDVMSMGPLVPSMPLSPATP